MTKPDFTPPPHASQHCRHYSYEMGKGWPLGEWSGPRCPGTAKEHFDVCLASRDAAVKAGAVEVTRRDLARMVRERGK